jgi:hypothetical protein
MARRFGRDASAPKPLTEPERAWRALLEERAARFDPTELDALFAPVPPPAFVCIAIGNRGAEDAFTHDATTMGFDVSRLQAEYGDAAQNTDRVDRFLRHEYVHLLQKAWLAEHPYPAGTPLRTALLGIWTEGLGNYYSLSSRWRGASSEPARAALERLHPRLVERLAALACAPRDRAAALLADLSMGKFEEKWGALPAALWLEAEAARSDAALRDFVLAGPDGIWRIAERHLTAEHRAKLREIRALSAACR